MLHIDGSHDYSDVSHDADLALELLVSDGVAVSDDIGSRRWLGVAAAVWPPVERGTVSPFATTGWKLVPAAARLARARRPLVQAGALRARADSGGPCGQIVALAVDEQWRAKGVGTLLMPAALLDFAGRGVNTAHAIVGARNEQGLTLYCRCGMRTIGCINVRGRPLEPLEWR